MFFVLHLQQVFFFPALQPIANQDAALKQQFFSSSTVTVPAVTYHLFFTSTMHTNFSG